MSVIIQEVIRRSDQGVTRPFLCRGNDGRDYFVKGCFAGRQALCCEWVAGRLGRLLGLPIPDFVIAEVPASLVREGARLDLGDLGIGSVFASHAVEDAQDLGLAHLGHIPVRQQQAVLLFDWWVQNADRTMTEAGGNANLLFRPEDRSLHVVDHNLAFDEEFNPEQFWQTHVFRGVTGWPGDVNREMVGPMQRALNELPAIWRELPVDWLCPDGRACLEFGRIGRLLERFTKRNQDFWARHL